MPTKNIFGGDSTRASFVKCIYDELRVKREFVSLVDILCVYYHREKAITICILIAATRVIYS